MVAVNGTTSLGDWLEHSAGAIGIVFSDIVGSTLLLHRQKTMNYSLILRAHRSRAALLAARFDGRLVDPVGDGLVAAFRGATNAYQFASGLFHDPGDPHISVRAGVHFGPAQTHDEGLIGRHVHLAARVMEHGRDHELWVSDAAKAALEQEWLGFASGITWITSEECELKGIPDRHRLWRAA
jgi:class 3 adenylate cyclase